jgi:hypothetical protein
MEQHMFQLVLMLFNKSKIFVGIKLILIYTYNCRNIRRCVNATGRLSNSTSPPSTSSTPTGVLSCSSRPSQPPPTVVHHRGAYYAILRPTSRRTDVCSNCI